MRSFFIRLGVTLCFVIMMVSWYFIPDRFFAQYSDASDQYIVYEEPKEESVEIVEQKQEVEVITKTPKVKMKESVPFIVQAPHAQWDDPRYQDACEEASLIMANAWLTGKRYIAKNDAEEEMEKMFIKEKELFGEAIDTSADDTAQFFREFYGHEATVMYDVSMEDLYDTLSKGNIIIAPTNGRRLENPHFTNGGPERHMVVIIGFDRKNNEFITNDPGTRLGRGYKYKDSILYNAISDYKVSQGDSERSTNKTVIVVKK